MHLDEQRNRRILQVLVGSRSHNLHTEDSDFDYRGVFVVPTVDLLSLGKNLKTTSWVEGRVDDTAWELGHFLHLATKCNPNILDVFRGERQFPECPNCLAPLRPDVVHVDGCAVGLSPSAHREVRTANIGSALVGLFPHVLSKRYVRDAFLGYSRNQLKKLMDQEAVDTPRVWKFGVTYIRALLNGVELLRTGTYSMAIADSGMRLFLSEVRAGRVSRGRIIDAAVDLQDQLYRAYGQSLLPEEPNLEAVNEFLLAARREYWDW